MHFIPLILWIKSCIQYYRWRNKRLVKASLAKGVPLSQSRGEALLQLGKRLNTYELLYRVLKFTVRKDNEGKNS